MGFYLESRGRMSTSRYYFVYRILQILTWILSPGYQFSRLKKNKKETVCIFSSEPVFQELHAQITTVPFLISSVLKIIKFWQFLSFSLLNKSTFKLSVLRSMILAWEHANFRSFISAYVGLNKKTEQWRLHLSSQIENSSSLSI